MENIERETIIVFNEAEKTASITTFNPALSKKLTELAKDSECTVKQNICYDKSVKIMATVPKKWIKVSPPKKISEEQKKLGAERLKKWRNAQVAQNP